MDKLTGLELAVIGISCKFPGADDWRQYWRNLEDEVDSIHRYSDEELKELGYSKEFINRNNYVKADGIINDKDIFDYTFFNYTPTEASFLNPVHRLFHLGVWSALEDAGVNLEKTDTSIGVFASASTNMAWPIYSMLKNRENIIDNFSMDKLINKDFMATLLSYKLDLKGSSLFIDTGCSSSLVAVDMACKSLLLGETDVAIAGGITVSEKEDPGYIYDSNLILSSDGRCKAFDKDSDGTVGSEGAAVVILKRYEDAIRDRDNIYCLIKGGATNNDGKRKIGYTAPSVQGQSECIRKALRFSKVSPERISYVETHGTGTKIGDPIEVTALQSVYGKSNKNRIPIGSVKTNIGHTWATAGIAGLIKVALSLKFKTLPASLHYRESNPAINFSNTAFFVNSETTHWERKDNLPLCAAVSSFGIGGTNAHVILEEFSSENDRAKSEVNYKILTISAKNQQSLKAYSKKLFDFISDSPNVNLNDVAYTLQVGRSEFNFRESFTFRDRDELLRKLANLNDASPSNRFVDAVIFMFPGSGSQYPNMGHEMYQNFEGFRRYMDEGFEILRQLTGEDYRNFLYSSSDDSINDANRFQPIIFLFNFSLAKLMMSYGIKPKFMIGHSLGEYVCACLGGVFSFEEALSLIVSRGNLLRELEVGSMISVTCSVSDAKKYLGEKVQLAAINAPNQVVFSGDVVSITEAKERLTQEGIPFSDLRIDRAMHSYMLNPILEKFRDRLRLINFKNPQTPFVSNLTYDFITPAEATSAEYWVKHFRETVNFSKGIETFKKQGKNIIFIELGGGNQLTNLVKQNFENGNLANCVNMIRHAKENKNGLEHFFDALSKLWKSGVAIDWRSVHEGKQLSKISLPTYSFAQNRINGHAPLTKLFENGFPRFTEEISKKTELPVFENRKHMHFAVENGFEPQVKRIFESFFGIENISMNSNFFELGGDSLKAVSLLNKIEKELGTKISISTLYDCASFGELTLEIERQHRTDLKRNGLSEPTSNLLTLFENKENANKIFFFPAIVGNPVFFRPLVSELKNISNSYGFYYKGIKEGEGNYSSIKEMALEFSKEILVKSREEKIILFGFSMGALVSFEVARILEVQGKQIELIIIDKEVNVNEPVPDDIDFADYTPDIDQYYLRILLADANVTEGGLKKFLLNNYRLVNTNLINEPIRGNVYAYQCKLGPSTRMIEWKNYTTGNFTCEFIDGVHWQAINEDKFEVYSSLLSKIFGTR